MNGDDFPKIPEVDRAGWTDSGSADNPCALAFLLSNEVLNFVGGLFNPSLRSGHILCALRTNYSLDASSTTESVAGSGQSSLPGLGKRIRSEEHTSELQSRF